MKRKISLLFLLMMAFICSAFAQDIFGLKGKSIIITSDKIAYKGSYNAYHDNFGRIYNGESLKKCKFSKENLYSGIVVGRELFVSDVRIINPSNNKKKAILVLLNTPSDTLVVYLPLYLKTDAYIGGFRVDVEVNPEEINLCYHDCDKIDSVKSQLQNKHFYFKGRNELYTFDDVNIEKELLSIRYYDRAFNNKRCYVRPNSTKEHQEIGAEYNTLDGFMASILLEDDLIAQCEQQCDKSYIDTLRKTYLNKELYLHTGTKSGFFTCTSIDIKNVGTNMPSYKYILTLQDGNKTVELPISGDLDRHLTLADKFREQERIGREMRQKEEAEYQAMLEREEQEYKTALIKKFGRQKALLILENKVQIGFTKQMCLESWGEPYDINRTITRNGVDEQWVYGIGHYLYFDGDILTAIQE